MLENLLVNMSHFAVWLFVYVFIVYVIACFRRDNSIMDIAYGPAFFICALATMMQAKEPSIISSIVLGAIGIWALRLGLRIARKNWERPEDARYAAWRNGWQKRGLWYFYLRSFLQINLLQGIIIFIVALPFLIALSDTEANVSLATIIGISIFLFGLGYESLADKQLDRFLISKRNGSEPATLMTTGLFLYSRRPNYFGESLVWWGLFIIVLPLPFGVVALLSPLLITYIVTRITGPMLENIFIEKYPTEYRAYMAKTNYFIPGRPRT